MTEYTMTNSILFDGSDDQVTLGVNTNAPADDTIKPINGGLSIAIWVKLDPDSLTDEANGPYGNNGRYEILDATVNGGFSMFFSNGRFSCGVSLKDGDGNIQNLSPLMGHRIAAIQTGSQTRYLYKTSGWHFLVMTWDGNKVFKVHIDGGTNQQGTGVTFGSDVLTHTADDPSGNNALGENKWFINYDTNSNRHLSDIFIGHSETSGNPWEGYIGDFAIWNSTLTNTEIETLYNLHTPVDMSTTQPTKQQGYWRTNAGTGTSIVDVTGNVGASATLVNGPTWSTETPPGDEEKILEGNYV